MPDASEYAYHPPADADSSQVNAYGPAVEPMPRSYPQMRDSDPDLIIDDQSRQHRIEWDADQVYKSMVRGGRNVMKR